MGNNVYSAAGSGEVRSISVHRGHSGTLYVDVQNDGLLADTLKVTGHRGAHGFTVGYYRGATNVTSQVLAGTFSTGGMASGAHLTLRVVIKVAAGSTNSTSLLITARSSPGVPVDAVQAIVHAT